MSSGAAGSRKEEYLKGLALSQLAPGPLAAQLAICLGYTHGRVWGATAVGVAFIVPSFLMTVALGALYVAYGGLSWMQAAFYGVGAAVIGIIVRSAWKLGTMTMAGDRLLWGIFAVMALVTAWTESEIALLFILCGVFVMLIQAPPRRLWSLVGSHKALWSVPWPALLLTGLGATATSGVLLDILWFFTKAGAFVFGSGLAIVPFLYGGVVQEHHWLNDKQFLDAVAVAMITPGPVVITVAFIGYLVAGLGGPSRPASASSCPSTSSSSSRIPGSTSGAPIPRSRPSSRASPRRRPAPSRAPASCSASGRSSICRRPRWRWRRSCSCGASRSPSRSSSSARA